jgi:hypothetical protein
MKLHAIIIKSEPGMFHVRLALGVRRFLRENIVVRNIGPRPWSEATWVDKEGHVHELFAR